jgi:hypothetical protein
MERSRLTDEVAAAQSDTAAMQKRAEEAEKKLVVLNPAQPGAPRKESWLTPHIEKGAKALNTEQVQKGLR